LLRVSLFVGFQTSILRSAIFTVLMPHCDTTSKLPMQCSDFWAA